MNRIDKVIEVLSTCTCTPFPHSEGPMRDCPQHGDAEHQALALDDAGLLIDSGTLDRVQKVITEYTDAIEKRAKKRIVDPAADVAEDPYSIGTMKDFAVACLIGDLRNAIEGDDDDHS